MSTLFHRFVRFAVVGVIATATHTAVFAVLIELAHIEPVSATALAFVVAVLVGFALNRAWTFAAHGGAEARLWRYAVGALAGLGVNSAIMYVATHKLHWSPYVGLALALCVVPPLTFALNQYWVFRPRASQS
jgi:putative flippase GtrA